MCTDPGPLHEPYAHLYIGDYVADTLHLTAVEQRALRVLLLSIWLHGSVPNLRLAKLAGLARHEWNAVRPAVIPLLTRVRPRIAEGLAELRRYDGQRLPASVWGIVRAIVFERDGYACTYCGSQRDLQGDHVLPLSRGGSNAFDNLATACKACNGAKGSKTLQEWCEPSRRMGNRGRQGRSSDSAELAPDPLLARSSAPTPEGARRYQSDALCGRGRPRSRETNQTPQTLDR